jgi:hypothetical protein
MRILQVIEGRHIIVGVRKEKSSEFVGNIETQKSLHMASMENL